MRKFLVIAALLALTACQAEAPPPFPPGAAGGLTQAERADCLDHGGAVGMGGLARAKICLRPTPDAGKACQRASDCSGACMADTLSCSKVTPQFGCYQVVMEDGQKVGLCVD